METFIDKSGKVRNGIGVKCQSCNNKFVTRKDQPSSYCSLACRGLGSQKRFSFTCSLCGKLTFRPESKKKNSKSGLHFCSRECKDSAQCLDGLEAITPDHYGTGETRNSELYRRIYKKFVKVDKLYCERCFYNEFECGVDVHHKDGNFLNNKNENLIALCAPCHRGLHAKLWKL